jgi:hypothetical protein
MPITINTDGISEEQKQTAKFKRAYQEMYDHLAAFGHVIACHEAAHLYYFTMAGMKNYDPYPAKLCYEPTVDDYGGTLASVHPRDLEAPTAGKEAEWLWTIVKAHAAGGVIARKLMPSLPDHGDQDDKDRFMDLYKKMKTATNPEDLWKQAQMAVSQELAENPTVLARLEKFAEEELRPQLGLI